MMYILYEYLGRVDQNICYSLESVSVNCVKRKFYVTLKYISYFVYAEINLKIKMSMNFILCCISKLCGTSNMYILL